MIQCTGISLTEHIEEICTSTFDDTEDYFGYNIGWAVEVDDGGAKYDFYYYCPDCIIKGNLNVIDNGRYFKVIENGILN